MFLTTKRLTACLAATCFCAVGMSVSTANAQSGTRSAAPVRSAVPMRSSNAVPMQLSHAAPVGLQGYCPVCVIEMKKWVKGNSSIQAQHDGKTYYFPGDDQRRMFLANPTKYTPSLGGDCTVCRVEMNKKTAGSIHFSALHDNRLFLFPNAEIKGKFMANPAKYANADLALGGNCAVCKTEMKQDVAGKPEFASNYGGLRYLFPSDKQRGMFMANPAKYAVGMPAAPAGSTTR